MSKKILVVDDDVMLLDLLRIFLTEKGYEVVTAQDGIDAFEKLKTVTPDLIILDVMMPKMDGYSFVRELKKEPGFRSTPVIVLTAREMTRDLFVQEGIKYFVIKPYDPEELHSIVLKCL